MRRDEPADDELSVHPNYYIDTAPPFPVMVVTETESQIIDLSGGQRDCSAHVKLDPEDKNKYNIISPLGTEEALVCFKCSGFCYIYNGATNTWSRNTTWERQFPV